MKKPMNTLRMNKSRLPILLAGLLGCLPRASRAADSEMKRAVFRDADAEFKWSVKEFGAGLPADWTPYQFLMLELRSANAQRFELRLHTANGTRRVRLHPFPNAWIRAAIPLTYFQRPDRQGFDLASLGNKSRVCWTCIPAKPRQ